MKPPGYSRMNDSRVSNSATCSSHPINCSILLQHLLRWFCRVYARCSAFMASLSSSARASQSEGATSFTRAMHIVMQVLDSIVGREPTI
jgi:hypothetical protein